MNKLYELEMRLQRLEKRASEEEEDVAGVEEYRKQAIASFVQETWLKEWATETLGREVVEVALIGSVLDSNKFNAESDIDLAFSLKPMLNDSDDVASELAKRLQFALMKEQLFTVPDVAVFIGSIKTKDGKKKRII